MKKMMMMGAVLAMSLMMAQGVQARVDSEVANPVTGVDQDFQQAADAKKKEAKILAKAEKAKNDVVKAEKALEKAIASYEEKHGVINGDFEEESLDDLF